MHQPSPGTRASDRHEAVPNAGNPTSTSLLQSRGRHTRVGEDPRPPGLLAADPFRFRFSNAHPTRRRPCKNGRRRVFSFLIAFTPISTNAPRYFSGREYAFRGHCMHEETGQMVEEM